MGAPGEASTIVVIEDDLRIAELVTTYLRNDGFAVVHARDGEAGITAVRSHRPRLVLLDVGLPGAMDGLDVCRHLRAESPVPIVMLTARADEIDRVLGLELGADDYVTKPFSPRELIARIKAVLRRGELARAAERPATLACGPIAVDRARREVSLDGAPVEMTSRELELLSFLVENRGLALTRRQILDGAWGSDWYGDERTVDVHVRQIRKKLGDALPLVTLRGTGYRLG